MTARAVTPAARRHRRTAAAPAVLVLSTAFRAGPWACRSLAAAGFRVVGAHHGGRLAGGRSLACPRPLRYPRPTTDPDGFTRRVAAICAEHGIDVVLSAAEDTARVIAERQPHLAGAAVVGPDRDVYAALCDKGRLAVTAALAGVDHPATAVVAADGTHDPWPPLPSVVKPRISGEDIGDLPAAVPVATPRERAAAVAALTGAGRQAIVQEYVTGERWVAQSVRDHDGRLDIVCSFIERDHPRGAGVASRMRVGPDPPPAVPAAVDRLLGVTGYAGPSTISFIGSGDRWVVHDVNLRLGSSVGLVMRAGLDMPRRAVEVALGLPPSPPPRPRRYAYARLDGEIGAIADAMRDRPHGESPLGLTGGLLRLALGRRGMVDPSPLEPFLWTRLAAIGGWSLVRRARRIPSGRRAG